MLPTAETQDEK